MPNGVLDGEIIITYTSGDSWTAYRFNYCVQRETLAPPDIIVTGSGGGTTTFSIVAGVVDIWFHESPLV